MNENEWLGHAQAVKWLGIWGDEVQFRFGGEVPWFAHRITCR